MLGTFGGFNTSVSGLFAHQNAMNTTSHNISNAKTEGFTRQQTILETTYPFTMPSMNKPGGAGQIGTGVDVAEITRIRDAFLDKQIRTELAKLGKHKQNWDNLQRVENFFLEPSNENSLASVLDQFWSSWNELSKNAENSPIRTTVKEMSITLGEAINDIARQMDTLKKDVQEVQGIKVDEINAISTQIANLNDKIHSVVFAGDNPNDLLDERDVLLDRLAEITDFKTENIIGPNGEDTGMIEVTMEGDVTDSTDDHVLVDGKTETHIAIGDIAIIKDGELKGLENTLKDIDTYKEKLDKMAYSLGNSINQVLKTGYDLNNNQVGEDFFIFEDASGNPISDCKDAANYISFNNDAYGDVSKIPVALETDAKGDGGKALEIYNLARKVLDSATDGVEPELDNTTLSNFYKDLIADLGVDANTAKRNEKNQQTVVFQLTEKRESISGVNIDEEMTNMLQHMKCYEASAKMITTLDEMITTIINMKR